MFNWVCPRCGKDVPPSKTECPYCAGQPQTAPPQHAGAPPPNYAPPQPYGAPPAAPQQPWQPPQAAAPPQPWQPPQHQQPQQWTPPSAPQQAAPPPPPPPQQAWHPQAPPPASPPPAWQPPPPEHAHHAPWPPAKSGPPAWLAGTGVAVGLLIVLGLAYYFLQPASTRALRADKAAGEKAAASTAQEKAANPIQKYIEVVGIRLVTQDKKPVAKFVVINHSTGEIAGLEANVTLWASTKRSEEDSVGTFKFKAATLAPNASQDITAPLTTRLKPYEMPDWQNLTAEVQITAPQP